MDRTIIAPWKAEEKELSEKLHTKLQGLALLYPMTDELRKCLAWDMFLKPNQTAFFHVMYYLFRLLDPAEFKRRFFWPITDKKSESNFRTSTVDYLKHLNEKHQLQWNNIKSYLVVMPGGMKFISFMLELVSFVVQELIKQREKSLGLDVVAPGLKTMNAKTMAKKNKCIKDYAAAYVEELENHMTLLNERTSQLGNIFKKISIETGISEAQLLDDSFLLDFEASNRSLCELKITAPTACIATLEMPLSNLKENIEQFQTKQAENKQVKDAVDNALRGILKIFGSAHATDEDSTTGIDKINALLSAFNKISDTIAEQLDANDHYDEFNEFVTTDLQELRTQLAQIDNQVINVKKRLCARAKENTDNRSAIAQSSNTLQLPNTPLRCLKSVAVAEQLKFVATPPIKLELIGGTRSGHMRLPLQDGFHGKSFESFSNSMLAPAPPRSARKLKAQDQSADLSSIINRTKIVDPLQLLRTINKNTKKNRQVATSQQNLTELGSKWKQLQASFDFNASEACAAPSSPKPNTASASSPFTPFATQDRTLIERLPPDNSSPNGSMLYAKKSAAVMKVLDASLNVQSFSTSPSGRLDPLVPATPMQEPPQENQQPQQVRCLPRMLINDKSLNDTEPTSDCKENDANALNTLAKFPLDMCAYEDDDQLQNVSDSVLDDLVL